MLSADQKRDFFFLLLSKDALMHWDGTVAAQHRSLGVSICCVTRVSLKCQLAQINQCPILVSVYACHSPQPTLRPVPIISNGMLCVLRVNECRTK